MAGQITQRGPDAWYLRVYIGRDANGKRLFHNETFRGGKRKADERLAEIVAQRGKGRLVRKTKGSVNEWLDTWLATVAKGSVRSRTFASYTYEADHYVRPYVGTLKLASLAPADVRAMLLALKEEGYAPRTIRKGHEILRNALEAAITDNLIPDNPARSRAVEKALPELVKKAPSTVPGGMVIDMVEAAKGERMGAYFVLAVMSGMRPSEILALRWEDIDNDTVSVHRVLVDAEGLRVQRGQPLPDFEYAPPKSVESKRAIVVPAEVVDVLKAHRKRQLEERLKAGSKWEDDEGLIFTTPTGGQVLQRTLRAPWKAIKRAAGLPSKITLYGLRHTAAYLMCKKGVPLKVVAERLGHSSIDLTADTYSHVDVSMQREASAALGSFLR